MKVNREALIALRKASGDTQESLATRAGITEQALWLIETGATARPRARTLRKLADALSVPLGAITHPDDERVAS